MKVFLCLDDHDKHDIVCNCGACDESGVSYGVGVYKFTCNCEGVDPDCEHDIMLDNCPEAVERIYACSEESAYLNAETICKEYGYEVVFKR